MSAGSLAVLIAAAALPLFLLVAARLLKSGGKKAGPAADGALWRSREQTDRLIAFLDAADDAYIKAYQYRSLGGLIQYTTRELAMEMQQKITYRNDKIWGTPEHRRRAWSVVSSDDTVITVRKELTFKNIKYGRMLVKLGDDCVEYWKVAYNSLDESYIIQDIAC